MKHGLRYIHLPIGYHGIDRERQLQLAQAVRDFPSPIYVHCHHGRYRGPTAAATATFLLDQMSKANGIAFVQAAGTSESYPGL